MNTARTGALAVAIILIGGFLALNIYIYNEKKLVIITDYKDAEYTIDGKRKKLEDGTAESNITSGSRSKIITRYFGNEFSADINNDGMEDVEFLVTQDGRGGGGIFFYVVAPLYTEYGYISSDGYLLGDRIAQQTIHLGENLKYKEVVVVNFVDCNPGESMTTRPSLEKKRVS